MSDLIQDTTGEALAELLNAIEWKDGGHPLGDIRRWQERNLKEAIEKARAALADAPAVPDLSSEPTRCANCGTAYAEQHGWITEGDPEGEAFCSQACIEQHDELGCPHEHHHGYRHPTEAARLIACENVLRSLASYLGCGGYNAPEVDAAVFEEKIRYGIDNFVAPLAATPAAVQQGREALSEEEMADCGLLSELDAALAPTPQAPQLTERICLEPDDCRDSWCKWGCQQESAASQLPAQAPAVPPLTILDVGFKYESGVHTPTVLVGFAPNDWDARDAFAASLKSVSTSEPAPADKGEQAMSYFLNKLPPFLTPTALEPGHGLMPKRAEVPITAAQALDALGELEGSARGDEPFNHFAAPMIRQFIEQTMTSEPAQQAEAVQAEEPSKEMTVSYIATLLENGYPPKAAAMQLRDIDRRARSLASASDAAQTKPEGGQ